MIAQTVPSTSSRPRFPRILTAATLVVMSLGSFHALAQQSTVTPASPGRKITLEQQLKAGLKATTKCDADFLDIVVDLVQKGKLPRRLVDNTFLWARDRSTRKLRHRQPRPMIYFKPALVLRAKRIGVLLPAKCPAKPATAP